MLFSPLVLASVLIAQAPGSAPKADSAALPSSDRAASTPAKKAAAQSKATVSKKTSAEIKAERDATIAKRRQRSANFARARAQELSDQTKAYEDEQMRASFSIEQARRDALLQMQQLGVQAAMRSSAGRIPAGPGFAGARRDRERSVSTGNDEAVESAERQHGSSECRIIAKHPDQPWNP